MTKLRIVFPIVSVLTLSLALSASYPAAAMEFSRTTWRSKDVLVARGSITAGDATRLTQALETLMPASHGARIVLLDSPGGSVDEALHMSAAIEPFNVHMVVPDGALCASACASILFVSGAYRTVEPGGLVGQHSCAIDGVPQQDCNETIAQHAFRHGVSHGSIAAFRTYVPPQEILWFSRRDVDCRGISRYPFSGESGFQKSEPCFWVSQGLIPPVQSAWRVDFIEDGFRAFSRPVNDHKRDFELALFCNERQPGRLFVSLEATGPAETIRSAVLSGRIEAPPAFSLEAPFEVIQADAEYSRIIVEAPSEKTLDLLLGAESIGLTFALAPPYKPMGAFASTVGSRAALVFVANNCVGG